MTDGKRESGRAASNVQREAGKWKRRGAVESEAGRRKRGRSGKRGAGSVRRDKGLVPKGPAPPGPPRHPHKTPAPNRRGQ